MEHHDAGYRAGSGENNFRIYKKISNIALAPDSVQTLD
jgi:hypothetical protein